MVRALEISLYVAGLFVLASCAIEVYQYFKAGYEVLALVGSR